MKSKRMKSIDEAAVVYGKEHQGTVNIEDFMAGANAVLEEIEDYLENYTLPKDSLLKFYVLSVFSDIHDKIKQLKDK